MTRLEAAQIGLFFVVPFGSASLLGCSMVRVFNGERVWLSGVVCPAEQAIYRLAGANPAEEIHWITYALVMFVLRLVQGAPPLNPQGLPNVGWPMNAEPHVYFSSANWLPSAFTYARQATARELSTHSKHGNHI